MDKPRVVKDFDKLELAVQEQIKLNYPHGFDKHLVTFKNIKGAFISALPFEAEDKYYLVRMTQEEARAIIEDDDDYNNDGILKQDVLEDLQSKHEFGDDDDDLDDLDDIGFQDDDLEEDTDD